MSWYSNQSCWLSHGWRVLLLACAPTEDRPDSEGQPRVPDGLEPLGLVVLSDELRHDAAHTLAEFAAVGVQLRLLSGDDPHTVRALALQAGMPSDARLVSGLELDSFDPEVLSELVGRDTVPGRICPLAYWRARKPG